MQFKGLALVASAFIFAACGGGSETQPAAETTPAATAEAAPAAAPAAGAVTAQAATGTTHEIKMIGDDKGYRFEPANITIKQGDAIKFVAVSGFPHNVAFAATGLSDAAKAQINANLGPARLADLSSQMYLAANEGFTLSFAGVPAGKYEYNCTPHLAMGMKGVITVE
jgi:plastocyanin